MRPILGPRVRAAARAAGPHAHARGRGERAGKGGGGAMAGDGGGGGGMWWHDLAAGGMSGIGARALTHPLDTLKAQQQVAGAFAAGGTGGGGGGSARVVARAPLLGVLRQTLALEGAAGLYRGFGAVAVGTVPANTLYFGGYEVCGHKRIECGCVPQISSDAFWPRRINLPRAPSGCKGCH